MYILALHSTTSSNLKSRWHFTHQLILLMLLHSRNFTSIINILWAVASNLYSTIQTIAFLKDNQRFIKIWIDNCICSVFVLLSWPALILLFAVNLPSLASSQRNRSFPAFHRHERMVGRRLPQNELAPRITNVNVAYLRTEAIALFDYFIAYLERNV